MFAERSRMARELHDTLLQGMSGIAMQLRSVRSRLETTPGMGFFFAFPDALATPLSPLVPTPGVHLLVDVSGGGANICDECVALCAEILEAELGPGWR